LLSDGASQSIRVGAGESADIALQAQLPGAGLWSPKAPALYTATVSLAQGATVGDALDTRFGFRRIEATSNGLMLNGRPIFLTGFNRHEDSPATAMAYDPQTTRRDLERMKEAGANFVRLCHYPHSPAELDLCDEIGLLVMGEIPMYFWNDREEGRRTTEARTTTALGQLQRMIGRDINHPAIIFWSVSNETAEEMPDVVRSNQQLIRRARHLDPSRLCVHVSDVGGKNGNFDEDDVVCVNNYFSLGVTDAAGFEKLAATWRRNLEGLHRRYPSKPILVTEFGAIARPGTAEEDLYARKIEADFKAQMALDAPYLCGSTIWCWADHPWPPGRFGGDTSYYGVLGRDRQPKKAFDAARQLFRAKQGL
jgi:beta-glucuronidase